MNAEEIFCSFKERADLAFQGANLIMEYANHLVKEKYPNLKELDLEAWVKMNEVAARLILELAKDVQPL